MIVAWVYLGVGGGGKNQPPGFQTWYIINILDPNHPPPPLAPHLEIINGNKEEKVIIKDLDYNLFEFFSLNICNFNR